MSGIITTNQFNYMTQILKLKNTNWNDYTGEKRGVIERTELTTKGHPISDKAFFFIFSHDKILASTPHRLP